jgi:anti-sigma B factor antagonist
MDRKVLDVALAHASGAIVVTVRGEIDIVSVSRLRAALDCVNATYTVVLDMAGVTFMDSCGLTPLAIHTMRLRAGGGSLNIRHASSAVRRVVESAGMGELLEEPISL